MAKVRRRGIEGSKGGLEMIPLESKKTRRRFLLDLTRGTIAAGLAAFSALLLSRRDSSTPGSDKDKHTCINQWICSGCFRLADCVLPQALSAREHGVRKNRYMLKETSLLASPTIKKGNYSAVLEGGV